MTRRRPRADLIPNANNPRLLQRLVRLVASGIRKPRALADVLQVELRTVHYYTQAGEWLGLLATDKEVHLTARGVEYAFAESRQRTRLYALAVWSVPLVQALLTGRSELPSADVVASFIREHEPDMAPRTARRRATALMGLIEPAVHHRPTKQTPVGTQMNLRFTPSSTAYAGRGAKGVDLRAGTEHNPDVYARLLKALLDHGELTTGHIRALLDEMDARDCPLGGYVEMALRRQDAVRLGDRLVVTAGAVQRREVADDGVLTALTDPAYRGYLELLKTPKHTHASSVRSSARTISEMPSPARWLVDRSMGSSSPTMPAPSCPPPPGPLSSSWTSRSCPSPFPDAWAPCGEGSRPSTMPSSAAAPHPQECVCPARWTPGPRFMADFSAPGRPCPVQCQTTSH